MKKQKKESEKEKRSKFANDYFKKNLGWAFAMIISFIVFDVLVDPQSDDEKNDKEQPVIELPEWDCRIIGSQFCECPDGDYFNEETG